MKTLFEESYELLNTQQRRAVDTIDGPVMVMAGPGTGKTQILAMRIANILQKTDVNPRNILALTFTEAAATNMRNRLRAIIGEAAYHVRISTFHAFCASVITDNPEEFPLSHASAPLSDLERFEIISRLISTSDLSLLRPINDPLYYAKSIVGMISELKREGIFPEAYKKIVADEGSELASMRDDIKKTAYRKLERQYLKHVDISILFEGYQNALARLNRYDFDDMIALTDSVFSKNELLLQEYQERFQYILVDEYQDTNGAQNHVVNLLGSFWGNEANIFVVGDINQSIYRFQGASVENVLSFLETYPTTTLITLVENYRSTQKILDSASTLIAQNTLLLHKNLRSNTTLHSQSANEGMSPTIIHLPSTQTELVYLARNISQLIDKENVKPQDIAIIYRNNRDAVPIADMLSRFGVPFEIEGGENILTDPFITQLFVTLRTISCFQDNSEAMDLFTLLNYQWQKLDSFTLLRLAREAQAKNISLFERITQEPEKSKKKDTSQAQLFNSLEEAIFSFSKNPYEADIQRSLLRLINLSHVERQVTFVAWFEQFLNETGFLEFTLSRTSAVKDLVRLNTLFSEIKRLSELDHTLSLKRFLEIIDTMEEHTIPLFEERMSFNTQGVRLTTAHKAKGQEWSRVFIVDAIDGKWGNNISRVHITMPETMLKKTKIDDREAQSLEDERRLFYVALTRAKHYVTITIPDTTSTNGRTKETVPSLFVSEIEKSSTVFPASAYHEDDEAKLLATLLSPVPNSQSDNNEEWEYIEKILENFKLSPTALNTYLECRYKFKLNHLFKIPRAKQEYLSLGTAVHKALEMFFKKKQQEEITPPLEYLLATFEIALKREILTLDSFNKRLSQGKAILSLYFETYKDEFSTPLSCERVFGFGSSTTYLGDIGLQGKVDRIDWLDKEKKTVKIIDYKTGRPKSQNEIEGKTANSTGAYKRQLVFYKLLTELDKSFTPKAEAFEFDFIEADKQSGKQKRVTISITRDEVESLKKEIVDTVEMVRAHHFERTSDTRICQMCEFKRHCWPEGIPPLSTEGVQ